MPLARVAREQGIALRTAERWLHQYRQHGLPGLVRKVHTNRGQRKFEPELQRLIEGLALRRPALSAAVIHRQATTVAKEHGWAVPSYACVHAIIRALDPALVTLAQAGPKAYGEQYDLLYRREASCPNEIWQADHTPLDIWVLDAKEQPARPWLTVIIDDYSRAVAGFRVGFDAPSILGTALTLRLAIWRKSDPRWHVSGIPGTFYTDNGKDFTSEHLEQVAADLKMQLIFSWPGQPRGRGRIERFFSTVHQMCVSPLPGYAPLGTPRPTPVLTLAELETRLTDFFLNEYHQRLHGETGVAPQARWEAGGFLPRHPDTLEQLDLLLLTIPRTRRIHQDGVHFQGFRYIDLTLAAYVGEQVIIRYDPRDLAEIRVYHQERFLCRAICQELAGQTISLKEVIRARNARRRQLREHIGARTSIADQLLPRPRPQVQPNAPAPMPSKLKRYFNE